MRASRSLSAWTSCNVIICTISRPNKTSSVQSIMTRSFWGTNDPFFTVEGAKAYQRRIDTGYRALKDFERVYCRAHPRISRVICDLRLQHRVRQEKRKMQFPENSTVVVAHDRHCDRHKRTQRYRKLKRAK